MSGLRMVRLMKPTASVTAQEMLTHGWVDVTQCVLQARSFTSGMVLI